MDAVPGDLRALASRGELDPEHVLREPQVHVPNLRHLHGQHRGLHHLRHRHRAPDGDRGPAQRAGPRQGGRDGGVVRGGHHHDAVQGGGDREPLEGPGAHPQRRRRRAQRLAQGVSPRRGQLRVLVDLVHHAGDVREAVPGGAVADGVDGHGRRRPVGGLHPPAAAREAGLAHRLRPQVLVHHLLRARVQRVHGVRAAVVHGEEGPRVRHHVQPGVHHHGGRPRLLHLRREPIRRKHNRRSGGHPGPLHAALGQGQGPGVQRCRSGERRGAGRRARSGLREAAATGEEDGRRLLAERLGRTDQGIEIRRGSELHAISVCVPSRRSGLPQPLLPWLCSCSSTFLFCSKKHNSVVDRGKIL